ncbi:hypothetical protein [Pseudomonas sp. EL_65y_Pfl2_R96]|uniref:hypothetical protein n=1 Tax=Pseudomonas sp. EL_65y_Pfl2_R96 TaxID=3088699 RepID=UPI0030DA1BFC
MDFPISAPGIGLVGGKFVDEDPLLGTPGSLIPSQWGNAVTEEILNVILGGGLVPNEDNNVQLVAAIRLLNKQPVLLTDTGAANAYAAANTPALTALPVKGYVQRVVIAHPNTGASTYAPDGLAAKPIYGLGLQPLQGGELPIGVAVLMYLVQAGVNGGNGAWIIIESLGGASQIAPATQSQHAMQLGQAVGRLLNIQTITVSGTYTKTSGTNKIRVRGCGPGGAGGGTAATSASQAASGGGGSAGAIGEGIYDASGFTTQTVVLGSPGTGVVGAAGGNGGTSTFGSLLTLPGGIGGGVGPAQSSFSNAGGLGGAPGSAPTGANIFGTPGDGGGTGAAFQVSSAVGGMGGKSPFGASRDFGGVSGYGVGGSGQRATATSGANNGNNGAPSIFIVEEYA